MATVQPFSYSMIEAFLSSRGYRFLRDQDNDFILQFRYDDETDSELTFYLMVQGQRRDIYCILCHSTKRIASEDWARVIMLCNTWNLERRWPKAYLRVNEQQSHGEVILEENLDLEQGIHQELLNDFSATAIAASFAFWKWMHQDNGV
jgi:hypothetical protein